MHFFLRNSIAVLTFSVVCLLVAVRILVTGELTINLLVHWSWSMIVHLEFFSFYLLVLLFAVFSYHLFPDEFSWSVLRVIIGVALGFISTILLFSPFVFTHALRFFQVFLLASLVYGLVTYMRAWWNQKDGSSYFLVGFVVLFVCIINDILHSAFVIHTTQLFYVGLVLFIFSQAIVLSKRFSLAFIHLQNANQELEQMNDALSVKGEEVVLKNEQLTQLNTELDSLVYRVSHDLRSPVASVLGLIIISQEEHNVKELKHYMSLQEKTLHRMDALIQDIIDYSRNKRTELVLEPVDFQSLANDILTDHSHLEYAEAIEKVLNVQQPVEFLSDVKRLTIVLGNLIANAIRYHDREKSPAFIRVDIQVTVQEAVITIADNGQGIGAEHLDKIFGMFYRASDKAKGSGLGLYLVS